MKLCITEGELGCQRPVPKTEVLAPPDLWFRVYLVLHVDESKWDAGCALAGSGLVEQ
jgi:hypothetical protein